MDNPVGGAGKQKIRPPGMSLGATGEILPEIFPKMTVQQAAAVWTDPLRVHLKKWAEDFNRSLEDIHSGHVHRYQAERVEEVDASLVNLEVDALRALLKQAGIGTEIDRYYCPLKENVELTPEELGALPRRVHTLIRELEEELRELRSAKRAMEDTIRRIKSERRR